LTAQLRLIRGDEVPQHAPGPEIESIRALLAESRAAVFLVDSDGIVRAASGRGLEGLGLDLVTAVGEQLVDVLEVLSPALDESLTGALQGEPSELLLAFRGGEIEVRCAPVIGAAGPVEQVVATAYDVSLRRAAERDLGQLVEQFRLVLANAPVVIFTFDRAGVITFNDGRGLADLGIDPGVHLGKSVFDIWRASPLAAMARRALEGETCRSLSEVESLGRAFETTYSPLTDDEGQVIGGIGVSIDVTERLAAGRAHAESEAKSMFLAGMSHEFRTPLNSILGFAQLLEQPMYGELTERQRRYVKNIVSSGRHLLSLVNDVLDISKVAAGRMQLRSERVDLAAIVRDAVTEAEPLAAPKKVRLRVDSMAMAGVGDPRAARQILLNLLANAIRYTPEAGRVAVALRLTPRGDAAVTVTDWGPGIAPALRKAVFDEFAQVSSPTSPEPSTGLGLCLSRRLAREMGGDVTLTSRLGKGSAFTLRLPAAL
jgi:signal transduction histidine kinase